MTIVTTIFAAVINYFFPADDAEYEIVMTPMGKKRVRVASRFENGYIYE